MKEYRKMIACWFLVTWCDNCMHSYTCVAFCLFKMHIKRLLLIALYVVDVKWLVNSDIA